MKMQNKNGDGKNLRIESKMPQGKKHLQFRSAK